MCQTCFANFLLFADDLKIFCAIKSAKDCKLLQSDVDFMQKCRIENYMNIIHFNYCVGNM
jgi:hypothetical protein